MGNRSVKAWSIRSEIKVSPIPDAYNYLILNNIFVSIECTYNHFWGSGLKIEDYGFEMY